MSHNQKDNRNPLLYLFSMCWKYSERNRRNVLLFWALFLIAGLIDLLVNPLIWAKMMDIVQSEGVQEGNIGQLDKLLILAFIGTITFWAFHGPGRQFERTNAFIVRLNYRKFLLRGVMTLPMEWHVDHHSGNTIDRIEKGTTGLFQFSEDSFEIIYSLVNLVGSYTMLVYFFAPSAYLVLLMILITVWIVMRFDSILLGQYRDLNKSENVITESIFDSISNITTVIILRVEKFVFNAIIHKSEHPYDLYKKNSLINEGKWFLSAVCCTTMIVLVLYFFFHQHIGAVKGVLVGNVYLLYRYLNNISNLFGRFTSMYSDIVQRKGKVANAETLAQDFRGESFSNHVLPVDWKRLSIEGLCFSYQSEGQQDIHLKDVALSIQRGERIAFVGESGSGKTTLLKLIRDLYHPSKLKLSVDGQDIPHGFEGIARAISLIPQIPEIFATTIRGNITLGAEADEDVIRRFTDMACFSDVVDNLTQGLNSSINEKGVNLSGGQQQRLAVARGLLASNDKDIVLLDEPTSSLDPKTEQVIYENIFREFEGKTIISSLHRLYLLPSFERVYVFDRGQIIASGTFEELLATCAVFQTLWQPYKELQKGLRHEEVIGVE